MEMTNDTPKNTPKEKSLSSPTALRNGKASPALPGGGVWGSMKLKMPSIHEKTAPNRNGELLIGALAGAASIPRIRPTIQLATIQPTVPSTRMPGKSRAPSGTCAKAMELERANVGE